VAHHQHQLIIDFLICFSFFSGIFFPVSWQLANSQIWNTSDFEGGEFKSPDFEKKYD
jgi:hypothetical protein